MLCGNFDRGLDKTHLHNLLTATAINMKRILNWLDEVQTLFAFCFTFLKSSYEMER
jgi:hypothetical protein